MAHSIRPVVEDIPETQTVSAGAVAALLARTQGGTQWHRISPYYLVGPYCRARNFQDGEGCVWCACEVQMGTPHGFRTRLVLVPDGYQDQAGDLARKGYPRYDFPE